MASPRLKLTLAAVAAGVLALWPAKYLGFVTQANKPMKFLLAPIQQPARNLAVLINGSGPHAHSPVTESTVLDLERQRDEFKRMYLQSRQEADDLRTLVRDLSRGMELNPSLAVRQIAAPVIGYGSDLSGGLLTVRAGRKDGVEANSVVVVRGVYLVGRVQRAEDRTCSVLPMTDPAFLKLFKNSKFSGAIMLEDQRRGPTWQLESIENGRLVGKVWYPDNVLQSFGGDRPAIKEGMEVRLDDDSWPPSAQMLVIGHVEKIETAPNDRSIATVAPIQDLSSVSEVMIRIPDASPAPASGAAPNTKPADKGAKP